MGGWLSHAVSSVRNTVSHAGGVFANAAKGHVWNTVGSVQAVAKNGLQAKINNPYGNDITVGNVAAATAVVAGGVALAGVVSTGGVGSALSTAGTAAKTGMALHGVAEKVNALNQAEKDKAELKKIEGQIVAQEALNKHAAQQAAQDEQKQNSGALALAGGGLLALKLLAFV